MRYNQLTHASTADRAVASIFVAGVTFVLGYTVVRTALGPVQQSTSVDAATADAEIVIPHEATLWADFAKSY